MNVNYQDQLPDKAEFYELFESTGWNQSRQLDAEALFAALQQSWYQISATVEGKLVGYGRIISDGILHALIVEMIVHPAYQGRGIGSHILQRLIARCQLANIYDIQLFCAKNKAGFYEKCGFQQRPAEAPGMQFKPPKKKSQTE